MVELKICRRVAHDATALIANPDRLLDRVRDELPTRMVAASIKGFEGCYFRTKPLQDHVLTEELLLGKQENLFPFVCRAGGRVGYEWKDVRETAKNDLERRIMAFRFDDSEQLRPVERDRLQAILRRHQGNGNPLAGPVAVSASVFGEIYALALDSSSPR